MVTRQTFYQGKHDLLTVYLRKLVFLSVTDFSLGNLPRGNFIVKCDGCYNGGMGAGGMWLGCGLVGLWVFFRLGV